MSIFCLSLPGRPVILILNLGIILRKSQCYDFERIMKTCDVSNAAVSKSSKPWHMLKREDDAFWGESIRSLESLVFTVLM